MPKYRNLSVFVRVIFCVCVSERGGQECVGEGDFSGKTEVWEMQMASGTWPHTGSLQHPPPQHHPNTPCITSHPSTAATGTTGATACGPVEQTHRVYPTAEVTGGERLGEQWEGNTEEIEGRGKTVGGGAASGAFCTLSLITQSFCHAKGRSTSFPPNQGISSEESLDRIVLRVSRWPFVCKAQICSVQHAATASSAFCRCVPAHTFPSTQPKHLHWQQGSQSNNWHKPAP